MSHVLRDAFTGLDMRQRSQRRMSFQDVRYQLSQKFRTLITVSASICIISSESTDRMALLGTTLSNEHRRVKPTGIRFLPLDLFLLLPDTFPVFVIYGRRDLFIVI